MKSYLLLTLLCFSSLNSMQFLIPKYKNPKSLKEQASSFLIKQLKDDKIKLKSLQSLNDECQEAIKKIIVKDGYEILKTKKTYLDENKIHAFTYFKSDSKIQLVKLINNDSEILLVTEDGNVSIYNFQLQLCYSFFTSNRLEFCNLNPRKNLLLTTHHDFKNYLWDLDDGDQIMSYNPKEGDWIDWASFNSNDDYIDRLRISKNDIYWTLHNNLLKKAPHCIYGPKKLEFIKYGHKSGCCLNNFLWENCRPSEQFEVIFNQDCDYAIAYSDNTIIIYELNLALENKPLDKFTLTQIIFLFLSKVDEDPHKKQSKCNIA